VCASARCADAPIAYVATYLCRGRCRHRSSSTRVLRRPRRASHSPDDRRVARAPSERVTQPLRPPNFCTRVVPSRTPPYLAPPSAAPCRAVFCTSALSPAALHTHTHTHTTSYAQRYGERPVRARASKPPPHNDRAAHTPQSAPRRPDEATLSPRKPHTAHTP